MRAEIISSIDFFFINLDHARDRRRWFEKQAKTLGLPFERISAEDSSDPDLNERYINSSLGPCLTLGEFACRKSHVRAWHMFLLSGKPFAAIFEDDACIASDLGDFLSDSSFPKFTELIRLETFLKKVVCSRRAVFPPTQKRLFLPLLSGAFGSAGYFVSREVAKFLLHIEPTYHGQVDGLLWSETSPIRHRLTPIQLTPAACIQEDQLAKLEERAAVFSSSLKLGKRPRDPRDRMARTKLGEIIRYTKHLALGADPFRYKRIVPIVL